MTPGETKTFRIPTELLAKAEQVKAENESLDDLIVMAVDREVRRRGLQIFADICATSEEIQKRVGLQPDSTPFIRALRDGTEPHV